MLSIKRWRLIGLWSFWGSDSDPVGNNEMVWSGRSRLEKKEGTRI